jgi:hypothetical protein
MESKDDQTGKLAQLPDGQLVLIEIVYTDGYASVRRIDGERKGSLAICAVDKLTIAAPESIADRSKSVI